MRTTQTVVKLLLVALAWSQPAPATDRTGDNIALGSTYTLDPPPNYGHCTDAETFGFGPADGREPGSPAGTAESRRNRRTAETVQHADCADSADRHRKFRLRFDRPRKSERDTGRARAGPSPTGAAQEITEIVKISKIWQRHDGAAKRHRE